MDDITQTDGASDSISTGAEAQADDSSTPAPEAAASGSSDDSNGVEGSSGSDVGAAQRSRRRGSRGGQARSQASQAMGSDGPADGDDDGQYGGGTQPEELPEPMREGRVQDVAAAEKSLVRKPQIGDTRAPLVPSVPPPGPARCGRATPPQTLRPNHHHGRATGVESAVAGAKQRGDEAGQDRPKTPQKAERSKGDSRTGDGDGQRKKRRGGRGRGKPDATELDLIEQRRGRERNGKPIGRYFMCVQVRAGMAQVGVLEGRNLIEHYVSRPADDVSQIHGNIYLGRVQNVLPGMEAAFVDIATPKNAVLYRGDLQYDAEDIEEKGKNARIEDILKARQMIMCQVTKNPIGAKGARLTQEVSLPGRFVVLIPNSKTYGISKRLPDETRKRLRNILDRVKPDQHGLIVRTAAEHATEADLEADMNVLLKQWDQIERNAAKATRPALLYREPELAVRVIREEFNSDYRGVVIDDQRLFEEVRDYVEAFNPELADRIEFYDAAAEGLTVFERFHVHEQVHKALDRKVWLPSGGS